MLQLRTRAEQQRQAVQAAEAIRRDRQKQRDALADQLKFLQEEASVLERAEACLTEVNQRVLSSSTQTIDGLITGGLRAVFKDQNLEFRTQTDRYRGKTALKFRLFQDGQEAPILDSYGGGVIVVVGVLLRVVTIMTLGMRRVLLLDESLSHVSDQYIPNVSQLLQKLCAELGFTILMVTHQEAFAENATVHYQGKEVNGHVIFSRLDAGISKATQAPGVSLTEEL